MDLAWSMLSKETRGMRMGVWATRNNIDMQVAYRAGYEDDHPMRASMLEDFRSTVLRPLAFGGLDRPWESRPPVTSMTSMLLPFYPLASLKKPALCRSGA